MIYLHYVALTFSPSRSLIINKQPPHIRPILDKELDYSELYGSSYNTDFSERTRSAYVDYATYELQRLIHYIRQEYVIKFLRNNF